MADINHVLLIGHLTRDAELKYTSGGMAVAKFALAVNKRRKSGEQWVEEASFFDIVLWGRAGEALNPYLVKGKQVAVEGELHQNRWDNNGQSMSKIEIIAHTVQLLGGGTQPGASTSSGAGNQKSAGGAPGRASRSSGRDSSSGAHRYDADDDSVPPDFPDDIPF